jgi:hypothetical protein
MRIAAEEKIENESHNPKVGGSNPPATNPMIGLQAKLLFPAGAKRGNHGAASVAILI